MTADNDIPRRLLRAEQVLAGRTRRVAVVLEGSQDPHNVHAVLRTAEGLGIQDVHVVAPRGSAAVISPGVTQRAHEWLSVLRHDAIEKALAHVRAEGRTIVGTANAETAESLTDFACDGPMALVMGNETEGLSRAALAACDRLVRIDLVGFSGSLNLSVATAICLWELRRRDVRSDPAGDLDVDARAALRARWYPALLGRPATDPDIAAWIERGEEIRVAALAASRVIPVDRAREA